MYLPTAYKSLLEGTEDADPTMLKARRALQLWPANKIKSALSPKTFKVLKPLAKSGTIPPALASVTNK
jgi:hypothetical protein